MDFLKLDTPTLDEAIRSDQEAIRIGEDFLKSLSGREGHGFQQMAESTSKLLDKLRAELRALKEERTKRK